MVIIGAGLSELNLENTRDTYLLALGIVASVVSVLVIAHISRKALERITNDKMPAGVSS